MNANALDGRTPRSRPDGFTLIEVIFALLVLSIGVLGLARFTFQAVRQANLADLRTERSVTVQSAVEQVRAMPWDSVDTGSMTLGRYSASWSSTDATNSKVVRVVSVGPGVVSGAQGPIVRPDVPDTLTIQVIRP